MGKLKTRLEQQLKRPKHKSDAEECLLVYEKLKEIDNGHVWESKWNALTMVRFGSYPERNYCLSSLGKLFLDGIQSRT